MQEFFLTQHHLSNKSLISGTRFQLFCCGKPTIKCLRAHIGIIETNIEFYSKSLGVCVSCCSYILPSSMCHHHILIFHVGPIILVLLILKFPNPYQFVLLIIGTCHFGSRHSDEENLILQLPISVTPFSIA